MKDIYDKIVSTHSDSNKTFEEEYNDIGLFEYFEDGFRINYKSSVVNIKWNEITEINVYKVDLITIDSITMQIVYNDKSLIIYEELPGWYQFNIKLFEVFTDIPKDWEANIVQPPFERNFTTIYKRE